MGSLCVIIPVHEYSKDIEELLKRAVASVPKEIEVRVSCKYGLSDEIYKGIEDSRVVVYESEDESSPSDFCTLVNQAVGDTEWFSILEFDDEFTPIFLDNFRKYEEFYPNVSVFMTLQDVINYKNGSFLSIGNEAPWASSFSNDIGYIDNDCLQGYFDFYMTGAVFNTADWEEVGGLKPSMKVSFWYEFMLRATNKGKKLYVIPKVCYKHYLGRENSLVDRILHNMSEKEGKWWVKQARKECFFTFDRQKEYKESDDSEDIKSQD